MFYGSGNKPLNHFHAPEPVDFIDRLSHLFHFLNGKRHSNPGILSYLFLTKSLDFHPRNNITLFTVLRIIALYVMLFLKLVTSLPLTFALSPFLVIFHLIFKNTPIIIIKPKKLDVELIRFKHNEELIELTKPTPNYDGLTILNEKLRNGIRLFNLTTQKKEDVTQESFEFVKEIEAGVNVEVKSAIQERVSASEGYENARADDISGIVLSLLFLPSPDVLPTPAKPAVKDEPPILIPVPA